MRRADREIHCVPFAFGAAHGWRASEGIKAMISERAIPESVFGRKRMAKAVVVRIPAQANDHLGAGGDRGLKSLPMAEGPVGPIRWAKPSPLPSSFVASLLGGEEVERLTSGTFGHSMVGDVDWI